MVINFFIIFICALIFKLASNLLHFIRIKVLYEAYYSYLSNKTQDFYTYKREIINLFKKAGLKDSYIPTSNPVGYGQVVNFQASVFKNFPNLVQTHVSATLGMFDESIGVFRYRLFESFNPLYWIETILFLPKNLFQYVGISPEQLSSKVFQIIWWIIAPITFIFRDSFIIIVKHAFLSLH